MITLCGYCLDKFIMRFVFIVDLLSLSFPLWLTTITILIQRFNSSSHHIIPTFFNLLLTSSSSNFPACILLLQSPLSLSFTFNLRLNQFQMSWWLSCWETRLTLVLWSLWSLDGVSSTGPSACVYHCPRPGRRVQETLGRETLPVCACFAQS